jgi:hypothetical protein
MGILSYETRAGATYDRGVIMPRMYGGYYEARHGTAGATGIGGYIVWIISFI